MKICKICFKEFEEDEKDLTVCYLCMEKYERLLTDIAREEGWLVEDHDPFEGLIEQIEKENK